MDNSTTITLTNVNAFKQGALHWANQFNVVCLLDNNNYTGNKYHGRDWVLAIDKTAELHPGENAFEELRKFHAEGRDTIFGFLCYDLKNQLFKLESKHADRLQFPEIYFFNPRYVFEIKGDKLTINRNYPETFHLLETIENIPVPVASPGINPQLKSRTSKQRYLENAGRIREQIGRGDFYELNYCLEFYKEDAAIEPVTTFLQLNDEASAPFSCFFKLADKYLLCASPERFLKKDGNKLISQPIKGTIRKGATDVENEEFKNQLKKDKKEIAENVMIVDLVRNDLSKSSVDGSVMVEELCGIYEFNTVNQMISTITSEIRRDAHFTDALKAAFPMGSMTGAPKMEVMKNIERFEDFKRGLYSGAVGYITPTGDFDFNVVIRSIFYNASDKYLSIRTGSAITHDSVPEKEYAEILLKAEGLLKVINGEIE